MSDNLSIQEFAKIANVEASTLRYWDKTGVFSPINRDVKSNYRRYSSVQLLALNFVTALSALDIPLETIAELRAERSPEELLELLQKLESDMDMEMCNLRQRYSMIHARRALINMGMKADEHVISVMHLNEMNMILWPRNEYKENETFIEPLSVLIAETPELRIDLNYPVAGRYDSMKSFAESPECPDNFLSLDPVGTYKRKAGEYLVGYARGYYGDVGDLQERMLDYANKNYIGFTGPVYLMYLIEEICTDNTSQYLAQCSVAVK